MIEKVRLAALDLGSNSFHALIADVGRGGALTVVEKAKRMPRIGAGIFETGMISEVALKSALGALAEIVPVIRRNEPEAVLAVATSAVRKARNGRAFVELIRARFDLDVRIISADEEARLSYTGARACIGRDLGRVTLFDLGGGSLEMVVGDGARVRQTRSAPIGVLRALAECPVSDPATPRELRALERWAREHVSPLLGPVRSPGAGEVVLCAGTARALVSVARALGRQPTSGGGSDRLGRDTLRLLIDRLAPLSLAARGDVPGLDPGRVDLIVHGAVILDAVLALLRVDDARVAQGALREGLILEHARRVAKKRPRPSAHSAPSTSVRRAS
jgi:exopolyphosphatase/guanosine-5'-triphosphate,3'-diphosphate pyrophosphatase